MSVLLPTQCTVAKECSVAAYDGVTFVLWYDMRIAACHTMTSKQQATSTARLFTCLLQLLRNQLFVSRWNVLAA
jgi:hypothetical protein